MHYQKCVNIVIVFRSMFVLLKGATKEQAFRIGLEIAEAVTATNPKPVKLKFEKVNTHIVHTLLLNWFRLLNFFL